MPGQRPASISMDIGTDRSRENEQRKTFQAARSQDSGWWRVERWVQAAGPRGITPIERPESWVRAPPTLKVRTMVMTMNGPFRRPQIVPGESGAHGCPKDRNKNDTDHLHRRLPTSCLVHIGAAAVTESRACFAKVPLRPNSIAMSKRKTAPFRSYLADLPGADREKKHRATAWRCDLKAGNDAGPSAGPICRSILLPACQADEPARGYAPHQPIRPPRVLVRGV